MKRPFIRQSLDNVKTRLAGNRYASHMLTAVATAVVVGGVCLYGSAQAASLIGDLNGDGKVNATDLSILLSNWGKTSATPTPVATATTTPGSNPVPLGVAGNWSLKFDDEFNGTSLDTSKWSSDGYSGNNVISHSANVSVSGGSAILTLASSSSGAEICTCSKNGQGDNYGLPVGGYAEARVYFPGNGTSIYNWPAWWTSGPGWPAAGENDIAEGLGTLTENYHYGPDPNHAVADNHGTIPGTWSNAYHVYGLYRGANEVDAYYDGKKVASYTPHDNGQGESLIVNVGSGHTAAYGTASQVKVDYVRAWQ